MDDSAPDGPDPLIQAEDLSLQFSTAEDNQNQLGVPDELNGADPSIQEGNGGQLSLPFLAVEENPGSADESDPSIHQPDGQFLFFQFQSPPFAPRGVLEKLQVIRPPPSPSSFASSTFAGDFHLVPFASAPFAPGGVAGKLGVVRPPVPINIIHSPVIDRGNVADAAPPVLDGGDVADAEPPVLDAAVIIEPGFLPSSAASANDVVKPFVPDGGPSHAVNDAVEPLVSDAGPSNAVASPNDVVAPQFVHRLYQYLMNALEDPTLASVMAWVDDFTFQVLNTEALKTHFGSDSWVLEHECLRHGMVPVGDDVWRHRQGYLRRGTPELLEAIHPEDLNLY